jgi:hypothetical protein
MEMIRVTFAYEDGTKKHLTGEDLKKWSLYNEQLAVNGMIHGMCMPYDQLNWEEEGKHDNNDE